MNYKTLLLVSILLSCVSCSDTRVAYKQEPIAGISTKADEPTSLDSFFRSGQDTDYLHTGWYYVVDAPLGIVKRMNKSAKLYRLNATPFVAAERFKGAVLYQDTLEGQINRGLHVSLDQAGTAAYTDGNRRALNKQIAFVAANQLIIVARVGGIVTKGELFIYLNDYTENELKGLVRSIRLRE